MSRDNHVFRGRPTARGVVVSPGRKGGEGASSVRQTKKNKEINKNIERQSPPASRTASDLVFLVSADSSRPARSQQFTSACLHRVISAGQEPKFTSACLHDNIIPFYFSFFSLERSTSRPSGGGACLKSAPNSALRGWFLARNAFT